MWNTAGLRLIVVVSTLFAGITGCDSKGRSGSSSGSDRQNARSSTSSPASAGPNIGDVLESWKAGRRDEAIAALRGMYDRQAPASDYRPYQISEQEFVALPDWQDRQAEMLRTQESLRELSRELYARAGQARKAGRRDEARVLLETLKRLGAANRGPDLTLLMNYLGEAMEKLADKGMAELNDVQATQPAGGG